VLPQELVQHLISTPKPAIHFHRGIRASKRKPGNLEDQYLAE
jgi:hypothetical protein